MPYWNTAFRNNACRNTACRNSADPSQRQTYGYLPSLRASPPLEHIYCLVTDAHMCEQLAQGYCLKAERLGIEPQPSSRKSKALTIRPTYTTRPPPHRIRAMGLDESLQNDAKCTTFFSFISHCTIATVLW